MADYRHEFVEPLIAASQINQWIPVRGLAGGSSRDEYVMGYGGSANPVIGMTIATVASPGDPVSVVTAGRAKGISAGSIGAWSPVGQNASGLLAPITLGAAGSYLAQNAVGISTEAAVAGQVFTILVNPQQVT